jgi:hypothetical protein
MGQSYPDLSADTAEPGFSGHTFLVIPIGAGSETRRMNILVNLTPKVAL